MIHTKNHITVDDYIKGTIRKFRSIVSGQKYPTKFWKCLQCGRVNEDIYIDCVECGHIESWEG